MQYSLFFTTVCWWSVINIISSYRLPTTVIPLHYNLKILSYLGEENNFSFDGQVWIKVRCNEATQTIILHSKDLNISTSQITVKDTFTSKNVRVVGAELDTNNEFLIIHLGNNQLQTGDEYEIFIPFKGVMEEGLDGFYRSSYFDEKSNQTKWLGVTQFEATSARKAFPCFDEPGMKAVFEITLGRKEGYSSISNMPRLTTEPITGKSGWYWDKYGPTLPMSTYLVAYIVSDFDHTESDHSKSNNVTFRIWARQTVLNQVAFSKKVGPKFLEYYEDFFNIKYPLPKSDMVAIPDFISAMENWGLVTFRESYLLFDPHISALKDKNRVAMAIAHELAHQWFGNLVTMKWWTDLWLKEGFATYMATRAVGHQFPQWNSVEDDAVFGASSVFTLDSLNFSHPVSVPIGHPDEISEIFDAISYEKGSFLIRMMTLFLGDDVLKNGVSNYLRKYEYRNADQNDLWEALTEEAHRTEVLPRNLTVKTVMDTWTLQTGYPLVTVERDYARNRVIVTQKRYFKDPLQNRSGNTCWWVPLSYTDGEERNFNSTKPKLWMSCPKEDLVINCTVGGSTWVLFNVRMGSLYRVNYDQKNWNLISEFLNSENHTSIPVLDKVQLIDSAFDLASTGHLKFDIWFGLVQYLRDEDEYLPWKTALDNFQYLYGQLMDSSVFKNFKVHLKQLISPVYERLGGLHVSENINEQLALIKHKENIATWACRLEVSDCVSKAQEMFKQYQKNPNDSNTIPKDLRFVVYCTAIRNGGEKEWDFLWVQYRKSNVASEKNTILTSLACAKEARLLQRFLERSVENDSGIKKQDSVTMFAAVIEQQTGHQIARNFLFTRIDDINNHLSQTITGLSGYISSLKSVTKTEQDLEELRNFLKENQKYFKDIKQEVLQTLETAKLNVQWRQRHLGDIERLLNQVNQV